MDLCLIFNGSEISIGRVLRRDFIELGSGFSYLAIVSKEREVTRELGYFRR